MMNERIRELWENSTGASVPGEGFYSSASKYNIEKFAEMIVKECLEILDGEDDYGYESRGVRIAAYRMKKHFGVE
jgi:hypothetical protein